MRLRPMVLALALILLPVHLHGQDPAPLPTAGAGEEEPVDWIAAVVGDSAIFYSQVLDLVQQQRAILQSQGQDLPEDPAEREELERELLTNLVEHQLLVQAALQDTAVVVSTDQVDRAYNQAWQQRVQQFQGESNLRAAIEQRGESVAGFQAALRVQVRQDLLKQQYTQARRRDARTLAVDESEVEAFFERERASLQQRPATISFRQAIVQPRPDEEAMAAAVEEAERILGMLRDGGDFADLARRFSDDPGSRQQGGDLGWFRRGSDLDRDFEDAAFRAWEGQVVGPVETTFGAHLIKIERVRGPERKIHHILVGADADTEGGRDRAREIREAVEAGTPLREFSRVHSIDNLPDSMELSIDQLEGFPSSYADAIRGAGEGEVVGPVELPIDEEGRRVAWVVAEILGIREAGEYTLDDVRGQIREIIRGEKFQARLMDELRARTHVEIRI